MNTNQPSSSAKKQIVMIYSIVAVLVVGMLIYFLSLGKATEQRAKDITAAGNAEARKQMKKTVAESVGQNKILDLTGDMKAVNQLGEEVSIQELKGKVWVFAQFYGSCPECNSTNLGVLKELYEKYKGNENFQIVTVSVKADQDAVTLMKNMADGYEADVKNWWFLSADVERVNEFCQEEMGYMKFADNKVKKNPKPEDMLGEIYHDMGIAVFGADMGMWAKVDIYRPMKINDKLDEELARDKLFLTVENCLKKLEEQKN